MPAQKPLERAPDPVFYAGGYALDLYCKWLNPNVPSHDYNGGMKEFYGQSWGECARDARAAGWILHPDRTATCPHCAPLKKARKPRK